jgi:hypothetical protein
MKIDGPFGIPGSPARPRRIGAPRESEPFSAHLDAETTVTGGAPLASLTPIQSLVALQEVGDATRDRSEAARHGHDILDELEGLKLALLDGRVPGARLAAIAELVGRRRALCDDPALNALLAEIELRAAVELAKLGRSR